MRMVGGDEGGKENKCDMKIREKTSTTAVLMTLRRNVEQENY